MEAYVDANIVPSSIGANSFQTTNYWMTKFEGRWFAMGKMPQILHYDRDHDDVFKEFRRGSVVSFDRNHDGLIDFIVHEGHSVEVLVWDEDFDGFFDKTISSSNCIKHEWSPLKNISLRTDPFPKTSTRDRVLTKRKIRTRSLLLGRPSGNTKGSLNNRIPTIGR